MHQDNAEKVRKWPNQRQGIWHCALPSEWYRVAHDPNIWRFLSSKVRVDLNLCLNLNFVLYHGYLPVISC